MVKEIKVKTKKDHLKNMVVEISDWLNILSHDSGWRDQNENQATNVLHQ